MKYILLSAFFFVFLIDRVQAQRADSINDSLSGFNINEVYVQAHLRGISSEEMDYFLTLSKRDYIKQKYNLPSNSYLFVEDHGKISVSYCINEDFENSSPAATFTVPSTNVITSTTGVNGWTALSGFNTGTVGSCALTSCCSNTPNAIEIIAPGPSGYIDTYIGPAYPVYSVFGDSANNGNSVNPSINCKGKFFAKLNNGIAGSSINRLSKSFNVTPSNTLFKFAAMGVGYGAHCCCDNVGISVKLKDCLGNLLPGPQYSITPNQVSSTLCPGSMPCYSMGNSITFTGGAISGWVYSKWKIAAFDLTPYVGTCVTIEVCGIDCPYGGHAGFGFFDAQCDSMHILSNSNRLGLLSGSLTVNSCASKTDTLTAPDGFDPYIWTGPPGFTTATTKSITTNIPGTYTLSMSGFGPYPPSYKYIILSHSVTNISVSSTNSVLCEGDSAVISAMGANSYTWNTGANTFSISVTPSITTTYTVNGINDKGCPASGILTQSVSLCTGINATTEYLSHFSIRPNPNNGEFDVIQKNQSKNTIVKIYDVLGKLVLEKQVLSEQTSIDISQYPSGIYFVKVFNDKVLLFATKALKTN